MSNPADFKFLIVDDFSTMRRIVRGLLKESGYVNADEAEDGVVALNMLKNGKFDFVVSDINMPNMNGFEFLSKLPNLVDGDKIPVVMLTSRTSSKHREKAFQLGASGFLNKPCKDEEFFETVIRLTENTSLDVVTP